MSIDNVDDPRDMSRHDFGEGYIGQEKIYWRGKPSLLVSMPQWIYGLIGVVLLKSAYAAIMTGFLAGAPLVATVVAPFLKGLDAWIMLSVIWGTPLFPAFVYTLALYCMEYEVTNQRINKRYGILTRRHEIIELYRVRDIAVIQPFHQRLFGLGEVIVYSTDFSLPQLPMVGLRNSQPIANRVRRAVRDSKTQAGVRVLESVDVREGG